MIHFISVGGSDAILIESNGHYGLVDASNPAKALSSECGKDCSNSERNVNAVVKYLDALGVEKLDFVITTHNHSDHVGGMPTIASKYVDNNTTYYYRGCTQTQEDTRSASNKMGSGAYSEWKNNAYCLRAKNAMRSAGAKMYDFQKNSRLDSFEFYGSKINFYNIYKSARGEESEAACNNDPNSVWKSENGVGINLCNENFNSIVVKVTDPVGTTTLLMGDAQTEQESELMGIGPVDVLKVGHHGVENASSKAFIDAMNPKKIIITQDEQTGMSSGYSGAIENGVAGLDYARSKGIAIYITGDAGNQAGITVESTGAHQVSVINRELSDLVGISGATPITVQDGWVQAGDKWLYYSGGVPLKGWQRLSWSGGENWFYFDDNGYMLTGWQKLKWSGGEDWFYFDNNGAMLADTYTPDGYYVDTNGVWDGNPADSTKMTEIGAAYEEGEPIEFEESEETEQEENEGADIRDHYYTGNM